MTLKWQGHLKPGDLDSDSYQMGISSLSRKDLKESEIRKVDKVGGKLNMDENAR